MGRLMKNALILSGLILLSGAAPAMAQAYVGLDGSFNSLGLNGNIAPALYPQSASGVAFHVGDRLGMFAGELGYGSLVSSGSADYDAMHLDQLTADGIVYLPIMGSLEALATAGGAETNFGISEYVRTGYKGADGKSKVSNNDVTLLDGDEFDWRAGAGLAFRFDEDLDIRGVARYQPLSIKGYGQSMFSLTIGVNVYL